MTGDKGLMTIDSLARALNAGLLCAADSVSGGSTAPGEGASFFSVSIDSRTVEKGALFVALRGSADDGHKYVSLAFERGAAAALVCRSALEKNEHGLKDRCAGGVLIAVDNTLSALQDAARIYLEQFPSLLKIGITGSSGKTTTKEIAGAIIGREKNLVMNPGNLNSETGLPLAVFNVRSCHEVGVFEMGMNRRGEIAELARILKPHIALITNIGTAHIGILGTKEAIAQEKKEIFSCFTGTETALVPADSEFAGFLGKDINGKVKYFGSEGASFKVSRDLGLWGTEVIWEGNPVRFGLPGRYNLDNALAAAAIASEVPVSGEAVRQGLESVKPLSGRGEICPGPVTVVKDYYNANPEAVLEAVAFVDSLSWEGRKIYVIGSMLELGEYSGAAHRAVGEALASSNADMVFLFGKETLPALRDNREPEKTREWFYTGDMDELSGKLRSVLRPGDLVLLKGSRGTALERLMEAFR
ncbi:MAG: UDP-N-acetylmuramoyl-tripeptide--D-alanyl-D-alanine ligase [Spirochaetaceae bacterium]|jgi:UDP-N-acetylmuramoyl-tripeptide--D-alanyl-D-alanine ligase|nr:UDP-N-acetylmuramoyl-tripeptide--D-alanyl-D-alanine ligase [Spirochaetaceae bacterium]